MSDRLGRHRHRPQVVPLLHAVGIFAVRGSASISDLQRPLGLSYLAAADVVEALEAVGIVGPSPRQAPGRRRYLGIRGVVARLQGSLRR